MFLPLYDGVALRFLRWPVMNWSIIAANVIIFLTVNSGAVGDVERIDLALGVIPSVLFDHSTLAKGLAIVPEPVTLLTGMFLHGGFLHLAGNMLFLWVFGDNVEDALGSAKYLVFYLAVGIGAALVYAMMDSTSEAPLIGASGAIAGVLGAYFMLYPRARVWGLLFNYIPLRMPALWCLGFWFVVQFISAVGSEVSDVGWWAHVGGFILGAALAPFVKRHDVSLFAETPA